MPLNQPDIKELQAIVDWVNLTEDVRELSIKFGDVELFISRDRRAPAHPSAGAAPPRCIAAGSRGTAPVAPAALAPAAARARRARRRRRAGRRDGRRCAPGTKCSSRRRWSARSTPRRSPVTRLRGGRRPVSAETVLCIVEVMKLMNNLEARSRAPSREILVGEQRRPSSSASR